MGRKNIYFALDPHATANNAVFEELSEDRDGDGELDPLEDTDFDGRLDTGEPAYGPVPQAVDQEREKPGKSGTLRGAGSAGAGGAAVVNKSAQDALTTAEPHISAGTWIGIALGVVILAGAAYAAYRKWDDMGRPLPWR